MDKQEILDIIEKEKKSVFFNNNKVFGIRGDSREYQIGDDIEESHSIYDDEICESLNSTCAILFDENNIEVSIEDARRFGGNIYLLCGDDWGKGEDTYINEIKIKNAEVIAILK